MAGSGAAAAPTEHSMLLALPPKNSAAASRANTAGLLVLAALIWSWVIQAEAAQQLQTGMDFNKPFFVVGFNHTYMTVLLPIVFLFHKLREPRAARVTWMDVGPTLARHSAVPMPRLVRVAAFLSAFYCVADYFWYKALANVSVAAGTAIFNCSPLFVYCFSICFLRERVAPAKVLGVVTSFAGVMLVIVFQGDGLAGLNVASETHLESASVAAGLLMVLSAACYAGYEVAVQAAVGVDISDTSTVLTLTGLSGLFTIPYWIVGSLALAACPVPALHEPLGWPATVEGVATLFAAGSFGFVFNVFLPLSICWTSPLETSVGCMLTIPLSGVVDAVFHGTRFSWECIAGSALVLAGFGVLEYASARVAVDSSSVKPGAGPAASMA
ncbi:hypothetical protein PybrP1_004012 [[Pythium] brassicae (nom. inval.)]|nr:hypothetical protein PybrP1_004012 [[Pythium] brassicae (nom. inval.)]